MFLNPKLRLLRTLGDIAAGDYSCTMDRIFVSLVLPITKMERLFHRKMDMLKSISMGLGQYDVFWQMFFLGLVGETSMFFIVDQP